jgi:MinD superfamily P-loop ATPase
LNPEVEKRGYFTGGVNVEIIQDKCTGCGRCYDVCRFDAIKKNGEKFIIDKIRCEGCGTCSLVCKDSAIKTEDAINGEWFVSKTRFGEMTHAFLWAAEENTGRLVTLIRNMATNCALSKNKKNIIIDGSPGIGCPVIASLTGANYALAITEPTVSGVHDLKRILDLTKHFGIKTGVVVNKYDLNPEISEKIKKVTENYSYDFLGVIPYDRKVVEAQMKGLSIIEYNDGQISKKIKELWKKVTRKVEKDNDHES